MNLSRRGFIKLTGATLAASSLDALGFGFAGEALAASVRPFKLTAATETRNTCTYCSVACGILIYSLGDRAKNATLRHHPYRGRSGSSGESRHAVPEGLGAARRRACAHAPASPEIPGAGQQRVQAGLVGLRARPHRRR